MPAIGPMASENRDLGDAMRVFLSALIAAVLVAGAAGAADQDSATRAMYKDAKLHKLDIHGDNAVVEALVLRRHIPITYDYVASLMRAPNAFGAGPACIVCHSSADPTKSYRGMDLSTCRGMHAGPTEAPARPVIIPGKPEESLLVQMLRNNRMPLGVAFLHEIDSPAITAVKTWIDGGAKNDDQFTYTVLPLFGKAEEFGGAAACIECHSSFRDPPSFNEVNLTSYDAIMKGAFSRTRAKDGKPGIPIVIPGKAEDSPLYRRLTMNRMPPGRDPADPADHANVLLLERWIQQGAACE